MGDLLRKNELLIAEVPSHEVAKMHAWKASSAGMRSWFLNWGFTEKKWAPIAGVPLHEVAKMHAWKASGAGMQPWLLNGEFIEKKRALNCGGTIA